MNLLWYLIYFKYVCHPVMYVGYCMSLSNYAYVVMLYYIGQYSSVKCTK